MHSLPVADNSQPLQTPARPPSLNLTSLKKQPLELGEPVDMWHNPVTVQLNKFVHKSLSNFACNLAPGCSHACSGCSVPLTSTRKLKKQLAGHGVQDADAINSLLMFQGIAEEMGVLDRVPLSGRTRISDRRPDSWSFVGGKISTRPSLVINSSN